MRRNYLSVTEYFFRSDVSFQKSIAKSVAEALENLLIHTVQISSGRDSRACHNVHNFFTSLLPDTNFVKLKCYLLNLF